jgi:hypothetical protein
MMRMNNQTDTINSEQIFGEEEEEKVRTIPAKTKLNSFKEMFSQRHKIGMNSFQKR